MTTGLIYEEKTEAFSKEQKTQTKKQQISCL